MSMLSYLRRYPSIADKALSVRNDVSLAATLIASQTFLLSVVIRL